MHLKKIYYIPGFISLLGLPVLFLFIGPEDRIQQTTIRMYVPSDEKPPKGMITFSKYGVYEEVKKRKLIKVSIWNEYDMNVIEAKLNFASREMERIQFTNDTSVVLKVELGDRNTYGDFIFLLNQALVYKFWRYALVDNSFYVFANPPPVHSPIIELPFDRIDMSDYHPPSQWDRFKWRMYFWWKETWYVIKKNYLVEAGFVLLIIIPAVIRLKNRRKYLETPVAAA